MRYELSPEAFRLAATLTDHHHIIGPFRKTIKGKWVLFPEVFQAFMMRGYYPSTKKAWACWQDLIRQAAYINQEGKSPLTGKKLKQNDLQLHHALITKKTIQGIKGATRHYIHHSYNCMVLDYHEHLNGSEAGNREKCAVALGGIYGRGLVKMWYFAFSAHMKTKLPNIF